MSNKLPIPRLRREVRESGGRRTSRACNSCRQRKIKCDGNRPTCSLCHAQGLNNCFYSDVKAVRQQKDLELMRMKVESYEELLRNISLELEGPTAEQVAKVLENPSHANSKEHQNRRSSVSSSSSSSIGSLDAIDVVKEDLNRTEKSRATGHMGKNSEVTWMQRLDCEATKQSDREASPNKILWHQLPIDDSIASMNYNLDYQTIPNLNVSNAFILPPKSLADQLLQIYLTKVDISFPFIRRDLFIAQYDRCYSGILINPGRKWLGIFNMIFAIGCAICRLSEQNLQHIAEENLFLARAKSLSLSESVLYDHDDLQQVQAEALLAFYFMVVSQINRSWKIIGIAVRSGIALGLNLQQKSSQHDLKSDEARKLLWWSIFRLENVLSVMTGRVSCLGSAFCSTPPPLLGLVLGSYESDIRQSIYETRWTIELGMEQMDSQRRLLQSLTTSPSLYSFYIVDLSLIVHAITNEVYAIDSSRAGRARVESRIAFYSKKVDCWISNLHPSFSFQDSQGNPQLRISSPFQISLALNYYSARIVLNRPCLNSHAIERSGSQPSRSRCANMTALNCLRASLAVMALLPDQPDLTWCYEVVQWWDLLHLLTQAIVILLLDISIGPVPTTSDERAVSVESQDLVWTSAVKGLSWLHCLGRTSEAARRAFQFFDSCIRRIAPAKNLDLRSIPSTLGSFQTSRDPNFPWLRDSPEENAMTPQQETQVSDDQEYLKSTDSPNFSRHGDAHDSTRPQDPEEAQSPLSRMSGASVVLDTDTIMSGVISNSDANIEDLLLSMVGSNAWSYFSSS
ncbi:hypothetical protein N7478_010693 [Penicillium angulare]|uniref:uncharacterized protein n=1 Tax=Penicillium angulare TaxID=116970 RepID=UPI00254211DE|nr:uncharacterized protein N7478_010693 [Penicillium angulare]KAJ5267885.1 hypothetical protein N7478_010693 [Penicillium angulare]